MFDTKDDYVVVAIGNEKLWKIFCQAIGKENLIEDERFASNQLRTENRHQLEEVLTPLFKSQTTREWIEQLEAEGIPCAPVNRISDVLENEQVKARKMFATVEHPEIGELNLPGMPIKFSETPGVIREAAPRLGEHNGFYKHEGDRKE